MATNDTIDNIFSITLFSNNFEEKSPDLVAFPWISGKLSMVEINAGNFAAAPSFPGQIGLTIDTIGRF